MELVTKFFSLISHAQNFVRNSGLDLSQYGSYLYLFLLLGLLLPAVILGAIGVRNKYYGLLLSGAMSVLLIWFTGLGFRWFVLFLAWEIALTKGYSLLRKKTGDKRLYFLFLALSAAPVVLYKLVSPFHLPLFGFLGISYLNFRAVQMIIELYDGAIGEVKILDTLYFLAFFPTLSSGPIDRYRRFREDITKKIPRKEYLCDYLPNGIRKIITGLGYKFVLATLIHTFWLSAIPADHSFLNTLNYMYAYSFYLFFDFAGYSNFAVGTSYILGVKTPDNFYLPFLSTSMKEFWTRWHISLSRWFGDYIYSRLTMDFLRKKWPKDRHKASYLAQMITMFTMGAWHGLTPWYLLYGLYQGGLLVANDLYERKLPFFKKNKDRFSYQLLALFVTFHLVCFGFLIFSGYLFT